MKITIYELLGLIKDGKAPKKISIRGNIFDSYSCSSIECYYKSFNGTNWLYDIDIKLNDEVEILDEEDEFIDIESFGIHYSWDYIDYKNIEVLKEYVNKDFQNIFDTLDKLIKNPKKLIERLDKSE